ncbi:MAG: hypothetical protein HYS53_02795 [Candidatus Aenigmarchaeota archaeon]|nr:hypothetical protein [Candidatus Aenigmarchaeota archaeon]
MSLLDSVLGAVRKFSPKKPGLGEVKQSMEPPSVRLPSEDVLKSYESRYEDKTPRTPMDVLREPQLPVTQQYPGAPTYPAQPSPGGGPKIDLILAEIETVKAQLKVLGEKLDILESHYRKPY